MNKYAMMLAMVVCVSGCASTANVPVQTAADQKQVEKKSNEPDTFDKIGAVCSGSTRMVYNAAKGTYEWLTNDENKARFKSAEETVKTMIKDGAHFAGQEWDLLMSDKPAEKK